MNYYLSLSENKRWKKKPNRRLKKERHGNAERTKYDRSIISNSWGTNSLNMNVVTTPISTPHSNRVKFSNVLPSCGFSKEKALKMKIIETFAWIIIYLFQKTSDERKTRTEGWRKGGTATPKRRNATEVSYQTHGVQIVLTWMWWPRPFQHPTQTEWNFRMFYHRADSLRKKHSMYLWNIKL